MITLEKKQSILLTLCAIGLIIIGHFALSYCVIMHFVSFSAVGIVLFSVVHYMYNVCELCVRQSFFSINYNNGFLDGDVTHQCRLVA